MKEITVGSNCTSLRDVSLVRYGLTRSQATFYFCESIFYFIFNLSPRSPMMVKTQNLDPHFLTHILLL